MIYLDYAATTPMEADVLTTYTQVLTTFLGNPDSLHEAGTKAAGLIRDAKLQMATLLDVKPQELIITSGATEANNLALFGAARSYQKRGKHIITSNIEHASVGKTVEMLGQQGFDVTIVPVHPDGRVAVADILAAIRPDTILVSIMHLSNELGTIQPIEAIAAAVKEKNARILVHTDMAQSIGKLAINLKNIDLATFSGHKFYAPKSVGLLYKREHVTIEPLFYGGLQEGQYRPGTSNAANIATMAKAMRLAFERLQNLDVQAYIQKLNKQLLSAFVQMPEIKLTVASGNYQEVSPYIINFQICDEKTEIETYLNALSNQGVCISTRSTCHSKQIHEPNPVLQAVGASAADSRRGMRVSLSHLTTEADITAFLTILQKTIQELKR